MCFCTPYFLALVRHRKKTEFLSLRQHESMSMGEYQAQFLILDMFALVYFLAEREWATLFVFGLHIGL